MQHDAAIGVAQRLQEADLLALERDQPGQSEIDEEGGHQQEDRRQRAAHVVEHVELMIEPGMRGLILPAVGRLPAVRVEQSVEPRDHLALGCAGLQLDRHRRESTVEIVDAGERLLRHPDDGVAAVIGHQVARPDGVDELGGQRRTDDDEFALLAVQNGREPRPFREAVGPGEGFVDHDFFGPSRLRKAPGADVEPVEMRLAAVGQRNELRAGGLREPGNVQQRELGDPGVDGGDAGYLADPAGERLGGALRLREYVAEAVAFVVRDPGLLQRSMGADREHQRCHAPSDDQRDGEHLRPEPPDVPEQLDVERRHAVTT